MFEKTAHVVSIRWPNLLNSQFYKFLQYLVILPYSLRKYEHRCEGLSISCSCQKSNSYSSVVKFMSVSFNNFVFKLFMSTAFKYLTANRDGWLVLETICSCTFFKYADRYFN